jgi:2'-5' RNA ligase
VSGDERLRLFCALRIPEATISALVPWQLANLRDGRIVPPENLHVTLAFLGSRPASDTTAVVEALESAALGAEQIRLRVRGYVETRSVGMLALTDEGDRAQALAERLHERLESLGLYRREARPWLPHLTVRRCLRSAGSRRPTLLFSFPGCVPVERGTTLSKPLG